MEPAGTAARQWAVQQCRAAGFEPDIRFEIADLTAQVRLIAAGRAVGVLPDLVWADLDPPVRLVELPGDPVREIFTAARLIVRLAQRHPRGACRAERRLRGTCADAYAALKRSPR